MSVWLVFAASCSVSPLPPGGGGDGAGGFPGGSGGGGAPACDADQDGWDGPACAGLDCDDGDAGVHPGAAEICGDRRDQGCDGAIDEGCGCVAGDRMACWTGPAPARGVGACTDGAQACGADGAWGPCEGEVLPQPGDGACDGVDRDCDGRTGDGCGDCPAGALEVCGNGLDDDCTGVIDDPELCTLDCAAVNPRDPSRPEYACCASSPPPAFAFRCVDGGGLPDCTSPERSCLDLDGDPATTCTRRCDATGCVCGAPDPETGKPAATPGCGFLTACSRVDCGGRRDQPCYSGPPSTLGVGVCHGGRASCGNDGAGRRAWGACDGEVLPGLELCGNGLDDDCDGLTDEADGATGRRCPGRSCAAGAVELCGDGLDDDCDGFADEGCPAAAGASQACWTGSLLARGTGACRDGVQREVGGGFGPCEGEVLPASETCGDGIDADCDGLGGPGGEEDAGCCVPRAETCNGRDDDCDGLADEGVISRCGTCGGSCFSYEPEDLGDCSAPGRTCENVGPADLSRRAAQLRPGSRGGGGERIAFTQNTFGQDSLLVILDPLSGDETSVSLPFEAGDLTWGPDSTLWVAESSFTSGQVLHLDRAGSVICQADSGPAYQIGVDSTGDLWVTSGSFQRYELKRFSGTRIRAVQDGNPRCEPVDLTPQDATSLELEVTSGAAPVEDENRWLWLPGTTWSRIDLLAAAPRLEAFDTAGPGFASGAVLGADGRIYFSDLRSWDPAGIPSGGGQGTLAGASDVKAVAPGLDASMWGKNVPFNFDPPSIVQFDLGSGQAVRTSEVPSDAFDFSFYHGVALDRAGRVWTNHGDSLWSYDLGSDRWTELKRRTAPRLYPGSTDRGFGVLARQRGRWTQDVDPGGFDVRWTTLEFCPATPEGSRVVAVVRFADDPADLGRTPFVCGPFEASPADLSSCSGGRRHARVEISLSGHGKPAIDCLRLSWNRK